MKTETDQREAAINTLKTEINEKEKQLKGVLVLAFHTCFRSVQQRRPVFNYKSKIALRVNFHDFVFAFYSPSIEEKKCNSVLHFLHPLSPIFYC